MKHKNRNEQLYDLGCTFRQLRLRKGFKSAEVFSFENDLNRTAYWRWENGENITMKNFLKLCSIHNISPTDVFIMLDNKRNRIKNDSLLNEPGSVLYNNPKKPNKS
jgi:hypothetical protein